MVGGTHRWHAVAAVLLVLFLCSVDTMAEPYCKPSSVPGYACTVKLDDPNFELHWRFTWGNAIMLMGKAKTSGWVGFGFSPTGDMEESEVVVYGQLGESGPVSGPVVAPYMLGGEGVIPDPPTSFKATNLGAGSRGNGWTEVSYHRYLGAGSVPVKKNAAVQLVFAYHPTMQIGHHDFRGSQLVTFLEAAPVPSPAIRPTPSPSFSPSLSQPRNSTQNRTTLGPASSNRTTPPPVLSPSLWNSSQNASRYNTSFRNTTRSREGAPLPSLGFAPAPDASATFPAPLPPPASPPGGYEQAAAPVAAPALNPAPTPNGEAASAPLLGGGCEASTIPGYVCSQLVSSSDKGVHLAWTPANDGELISFAVTAPTTGWFAVGWSETGEMQSSDAVIAMDDPPTVRAYRIRGTSKASIVEQPNLFALYNASVSSDGTTTTLRFQRQYGDGMVPIVKGSPSTMIWAYSRDNDKALGYHANSRGKFIVSVDPNSPASDSQPLETEEPVKQMYYQIHGWLMFAAFGILFPLGVFSARFGQAERFSPQWYHLHRVIGVLGLLVATISVAVAFTKLKGGMGDVHGKLGITAMVFIWIQPFIGVFRPTLGSPGRIQWYATHWLIGTASVILGIINLFIGLVSYKEFATIKYYTGSGMRTVLAVYVALLGFTYLFLSQLPYIQHQGQKPNFYSQPRQSTTAPSAKRLIEEDPTV